MARITRRLRHPPDGVDTYILGGKAINVLAEGRLVNLATPKGMGHPIE